MRASSRFGLGRSASVLLALAGTGHAFAASPFAASLNLSTLNGASGFVLNGTNAFDGSGISVSRAGDVNGDGIGDLIIGASRADPSGQSSAGASYIVFGNAAGFPASLGLSALDGASGFVVNGIDANDRSGFSVASAGDVNGDGIDDLIIGARDASPNGQSGAGETYVVFGKATPFAAFLDLSTLDGSNGFVVSGIDAGDRSGYSVSSAGDVNGDGIDDVIIGARYADPNGQSNAGESYVVFGKATPFAASLNLATLDGSNGFLINGIDASDFSGVSVSSAGDVNGDGIDDVIIGAFGAAPNGQPFTGESYVVFGKATPFAAALDLSTLNGANGFVLSGIDSFDYAGRSVASAGDVNGDGIGDLIIGARGGDPNGQSYSGESYVVFGRSAPFAASLDLSTLDGTSGFVLNGIDPIDFSGTSVASAGDVNGDGYADLVIGADSADPNGQSYAGESYVVFGKAAPFAASLDLSTLDGTNGFVLNGIDPLDFSGSSVSSAGDVNDDGIDDVIVGASASDPDGATNAGESYVIFGRAAQAWTSPAGGSWDTGARWLSGVAPTRGTVVIDTPVGVTVTGPADPVFLDRVTLGADAGRTTLSLAPNAYMEIADALTIPASAGLGGSGVLVADAGIANAGVITPTDLVLVSAGGLTNTGDIRVESFAPSQTPKVLAVFGPVTVSTGGEVVVRGAAVIDAPDGLTNEGTVSIVFADATVYGSVDNTSLMSISGASAIALADDATNSGTIELTTDSSLSILGTLTGDGVDGPGGGAAGPVYVEGGIIPAFALQAGIAFFGGNVALGSVGTTTIEIGGATPGTSHDQIASLGAIGAAGTLEVRLINGYIPQPGDAYVILDAASITGSFASIILDPALVNAGADTSTLYTDGTIRIPAPSCVGDVNSDGFTNAADFVILAGNFGASVTPNTNGDLNSDGLVNAADFVILAGDFGCGG